MWCCTSGLDLVGELEGELKKLGHLEPTLAKIVKSDVCNGPEACGPLDHTMGPGIIVITGSRVPDHFPSACRHLRVVCCQSCSSRDRPTQ